MTKQTKNLHKDLQNQAIRALLALQHRSGQTAGQATVTYMAKRSKNTPKRTKKPGIRVRAANAYLTAEQSIREPASIAPRIRAFLLKLWKARGGGYYGLGYVITFISLEISMFFVEVGETEGVVDFVGEQIMSLVFRFAFESFINSLLALIWPVLLLGKFGSIGILILVGSFILFQWGIKPGLDNWFELSDTNSSTGDQKKQ